MKCVLLGGERFRFLEDVLLGSLIPNAVDELCVEIFDREPLQQ